MTKATPRKRRARGSIDPEQILDGAFEVARREGLEGLSMPGLAAHLDIGVTSIYWYYKNKEDLLRQMGARVANRVREKGPRPSEYGLNAWKQFMSDASHYHRRIAATDDLIVDLVYLRTSSYSRSTTRFVYAGLEEIIAYLREVGFGLKSAWQVYSTLSLYTRGFIIVERIRRINQTPPVGTPQLNLLDVDEMPLLTELIMSENIIIDNTGDDSFEFGINYLIDQAEAVLSQETASTWPAR